MKRKALNEKIIELKELLKLSLTFAPKNNPKGLDSTMYYTMSYEGDEKILNKLEKARKIIKEY